MSSRYLMVSVLPLMVAGCIIIPLPGSEATVTTPMYRSDGQQIGNVVMTTHSTGAMLHIEAAGLPPGQHAIHVHNVGLCGQRSDFSTAGPHWNPNNREHGHNNPAGYHFGDLGNVAVGPDGKISTTLTIPGARVTSQDSGTGELIADGDGAALVVHAGSDDERTDPSGNSGDRIACAVLAVPAATR